MLAADERTHHQCGARHHVFRPQQNPAMARTRLMRQLDYAAYDRVEAIHFAQA